MQAATLNLERVVWQGRNPTTCLPVGVVLYQCVCHTSVRLRHRRERGTGRTRYGGGLELIGRRLRSPSSIDRKDGSQTAAVENSNIEAFLLVIAGDLGEADHLRIDGDPRGNYPNESFCLRSPQRRRIFHHHGSRYANTLVATNERAQRHAIFWIILKRGYATDADLKHHHHP